MYRALNSPTPPPRHAARIINVFDFKQRLNPVKNGGGLTSVCDEADTGVGGLDEVTPSERSAVITEPTAIIPV